MIRLEIHVAGLALTLTMGRAEPAQPPPAEPEQPRVHSGVAGFQAEPSGQPTYADDCPGIVRSPT